MNGQMNPAQARVVDEILQDVAKGYAYPGTLIADSLFPVVPVVSRGGLIITFGREQFQIVSSKRAPGADTLGVQIGYGSEKYSLVDDRLMAIVPRELAQESAEGPGIDLVAKSIYTVQRMKDTERENDAALLARASGAYLNTNKTSLTGADMFDKDTSNPFAVITAGKQAIRKKIGKKPNTLVLGPDVLSALSSHPMVMDKISTSTDRVPATIEQLQRMFEISRIIEGEAIKDDNGTFKDIWGNDAILAYVDQVSLKDSGSMNFGYTYRYKGMPMVEPTHWNYSKASYETAVTNAQQIVLTCADAGYLIKNAVPA